MKRIVVIAAVIVALLAAFSLMFTGSSWAQSSDWNDVEFTGIIQAQVGNTWIVAGRTVFITGDTEIDESNGQATVGALVKVEGKWNRSHTAILADKVDVLTPAGGATPTMTPTWEPSETPEPPHTPTMTPTWEPSETPEPPHTPTMTPTVTPTRHPTETPEPPAARDVTFLGIIESQQGNEWVVSGVTVIVTSTTRIDESEGPATVGSPVKVDGTWNPDRSALVANEVEVLSPSDVRFTFQGVIEAQGEAAWTISGIQVTVDSHTEIDERRGAAVVGARVKVWAVLQPDGSLYAQRIKVLESRETPTVTPTPPQRVHFRGIIMEQQDDVWVINGREVQITPDTVIDEEHGRAVVGALVEVDAYVQDGALVARRIEVLRSQMSVPTAFRGTIERMSADTWIVSGRTVHLTDETDVENEDRAQVGALVVVYGNLQSDGSIEAKRIIVLGTPEQRRRQTEFRGRIRSFSDTEWVVGNYTVTVTANTIIVGTPQVGLLAEVHAVEQNGQLVATRIRVQPQPPANRVKFEGIVESIGDTSLVVSGRTVQVTAATFIDESRGMLEVGSQVEVIGIEQADGSILARVIRVED